LIRARTSPASIDGSMSSLSAMGNGRSRSIRALRSRNNNGALRRIASFAQHPLERGLDVDLRRIENRQARSCRFAQNERQLGATENHAIDIVALFHCLHDVD